MNLALKALFVSAAGLIFANENTAAPANATEPPVVPVGYDAFLKWDEWPTLRLGVRAYMKSTFDRNGGNHFADAAHYIRQVDDAHNVALDETGPGILWFVRHNHWHGSPWSYTVDGIETIVTESSTADPTRPLENSVFQPERLFPSGLTYTWSVTKGADLSWVPIPFQKSLQLAYGRTRYGTGYFIFWKFMPGLANISRPLGSWNTNDIPPRLVLELLQKSGTDIAPTGQEAAGTVSLKPFESRSLAHRGEPARLRRIAFRVPESAAEAFIKARLRLWWDDRKEPSIDVPAGLFFGTASLMRNPDQEYIVKAFPMTVRYANGQFEFATYFPMPFRKSMRMELAEMAGEDLNNIQWSVRSEPWSAPANTAGYFHATYRDFPRPEHGRELVLLDTRQVEGGGAWSGHIVGTTYLFTKAGRLGTLEGDPRFFFDDSRSPQVQGTGSEEWGGGGDYWGGRTMTLPFAGHPVGRPPKDQKTDLDRIHSAYRFLLTDLMPFGRNALITLEHGGENESVEEYETVTYWYGLDQPSLVLTDEFDVGNKAEEELHVYRSSESSEPESVSSRFELGVNRIPIRGAGVTERRFHEVFPESTDDGRRTRGSSEFTLKLATNNLGVLLRRRLDLKYPNQKALVLVSPTEGEPKWEEVGTWYTAGGNPAVFGDPLGLPKDQQKGNPELAPPIHMVWPSNRRWREDEFMLPRNLTQGRSSIRIRLEFQPVGLPLFPGHPAAEEAWTEFRYWAYSFVMPQVRE